LVAQAAERLRTDVQASCRELSVVMLQVLQEVVSTLRKDKQSLRMPNGHDREDSCDDASRMRQDAHSASFNECLQLLRAHAQELSSLLPGAVLKPQREKHPAASWDERMQALEVAFAGLGSEVKACAQALEAYRDQPPEGDRGNSSVSQSKTSACCPQERLQECLEARATGGRPIALASLGFASLTSKTVVDELATAVTEPVPQMAGDSTENISVIKSRLQEIREGIKDRTPSRSPAPHTPCGISRQQLQQQQQQSARHPQRHSCPAPAASGSALIATAAGVDSSRGCRVSGKTVPVISEEVPPRLPGPTQSNALNRSFDSGRRVLPVRPHPWKDPSTLMPQSPVPGVRSPTSDASADASGFAAVGSGQQQCTHSVARTLSQRSLPAGVQTAPSIRVTRQVTSGSGTSLPAWEVTRDLTSLSGEELIGKPTRPNSRSSLGVSVQVPSAQGHQSGSPSSWQFQVMSQPGSPHGRMHQPPQLPQQPRPLWQRNSTGPAGSNSSGPAPAPPLGAPPNVPAKRRPAQLAIAIPTTSHGSPNMQPATSPRQSLSYRLGANAAAAAAAVASSISGPGASPRPWGGGTGGVLPSPNAEQSTSATHLVPGGVLVSTPAGQADAERLAVAERAAQQAAAATAAAAQAAAAAAAAWPRPQGSSRRAQSARGAPVSRSRSL